MKSYLIFIFLCQLILVFDYTQGSSNQSPSSGGLDKTGKHRHRHRHRQLFAKLYTHLDTDPLQDDISIIEVYKTEMEQNWTSDPLIEFNNAHKQPLISASPKSTKLKKQILAGIQRVLNFYGSHVDLLKQDSNPVGGLSFLRAVDNKYEQPFQTAHPISDWTTKICGQIPKDEAEFCNVTDKLWKQREGHTWKSPDVIKSFMSSWELIGHEKDYLWGKLNGQCQSALVERCDVPYLYEITLYDPIPRSQYFLSHQLLQRIMTEQSDCAPAKKYLNETVNDQLCSKMLQEATLISQMGFPSTLRDIFSEYVSFCGHMRYPNFFREDWIENLLSWQSKSEYGCFVYDKEYESKFVSTDTPIRRRATADEKQNGVTIDEDCRPHFTAVALSALATSWDYMEANCEGA